MGATSKIKNYMNKYVALLRGINVVTKNVPMAKLRQVLEKLGFKSVQTLLASGNAIFEADEANVSMLKKNIEAALAKKFGLEVDVIIRTKQQIKTLVTASPFKHVRMTPGTRLYVTFLLTSPSSASPKIAGKGFKILQATKEEILWTIALAPDIKSPDVMTLLEKTYGKKITTRNWNTVVKIAKAFGVPMEELVK